MPIEECPIFTEHGIDQACLNQMIIMIIFTAIIIVLALWALKSMKKEETK